MSEEENLEITIKHLREAIFGLEKKVSTYADMLATIAPYISNEMEVELPDYCFMEFRRRHAAEFEQFKKDYFVERKN